MIATTIMSSMSVKPRSPARGEVSCTSFSSSATTLAVPGRPITYARMGSVSAYDLRTTQPRGWSVQVDAVIWLPRLIDKARAYDAGTLGLYLYGQSPVDGALLGAARIDYAALLDAVRAAPDDDGVLREIERRAPGATQRLQT